MIRKIQGRSSAIKTGIECSHPALYNSLCVSCGKKVDDSSNLEIQNGHAKDTKDVVFTLRGGSQLKLSTVEAERVEKSKLQTLHSMRKLGLILDIDHTILHGTPVKMLPPPDQMEKYGLVSIAVNTSDGSGSNYFHLLKLRPHLRTFLDEVKNNYELSIYTAGTRAYAESVVKLIDPDGSLFRRRIVSRSDAQDSMANAGLEKSLSRLFIGGSSDLAVILDDREDVWKGTQSQQLLLVRPFVYFMDAIEINNTSGDAPVSTSSSASTVISLNGNKPGALRMIPHPTVNGVYGHVSGLAVSAEAHFDDMLLRSLALLSNLHTTYYSLYDQNMLNVPSEDMKVQSLLSKVKNKVLQGCHITFSGVIPKNESFPECNFFWRLAKSLGAKVTFDLTDDTTHLVTNTVEPKTHKVSKCVSRNNVYILHTDWLIYSRYVLCRADERTFSLIPGTPTHDVMLHTTMNSCSGLNGSHCNGSGSSSSSNKDSGELRSILKETWSQLKSDEDNTNIGTTEAVNNEPTVMKKKRRRISFQDVVVEEPICTDDDDFDRAMNSVNEDENKAISLTIHFNRSYKRTDDHKPAADDDPDDEYAPPQISSNEYSDDVGLVALIERDIDVEDNEEKNEDDVEDNNDDEDDDDENGDDQDYVDEEEIENGDEDNAEEEGDDDEDDVFDDKFDDELLESSPSTNTVSGLLASQGSSS